MLFTVAGSSCSGKTTLARACADLERLAVHDFDEVGVPAGADLRWRHEALEGWVRRALAYQDEGVDLLLTGQSPLGEVLATPSAVRLDGIAACLLDVADGERLRRLNERDPGRWDEATTQRFIGWAAWHRGHARDPRYRPEVLTDGGWDQMRWARWADWHAGDPRWLVPTVDTTDRSITDAAAELRHWIETVRQAPTSDWTAPLGRPGRAAV